MKTTTYAVMFGCLFMMMGGRCFAADSAENKSMTAKDQQIAELGAIKDSDHLRAWVDSIKPAAGHVEPVHKGTDYWERSVRRENRRQMQE